MVEIVNTIFNDFPFLVKILFPISEPFFSSVEIGVKGEIRWVRKGMIKNHALRVPQKKKENKNKTEN